MTTKYDFVFKTQKSALDLRPNDEKNTSKRRKVRKLSISLLCSPQKDSNDINSLINEAMKSSTFYEYQSENSKNPGKKVT